MAFDINEARAIVEEAKKRGLIRGTDSTPEQTPTERDEHLQREAKIDQLPEWLRKGIREPRGSDDQA